MPWNKRFIRKKPYHPARVMYVICGWKAFKLGSAYPVAAFALGTVKLVIGTGDEVAIVIPLGGNDAGHPNAYGDEIGNGAQAVANMQFFHCRPDLFCQECGSHQGGSWKDQDEFFPPIATGQVGGPQSVAPNCFGHPFQALVSLLVSIVVVVKFEIVDIDHDHRHVPQVA